MSDMSESKKSLLDRFGDDLVDENCSERKVNEGIMMQE
jgi:hypothetical protein